MRFALNENGLRIQPSYSGQKATCPLCEGMLIGKCGDIYVWHWQHHRERECDPWKEHETEWHRIWKRRFPEAWQEVMIEYEGEKHIADVKTYGGTVIEFQNSPISTSTIRIREDFYDNMIWVVNAKQFKNNFKIRSVVSSSLRGIEQRAHYELKSLQDSYGEDLKAIGENIKKNEKDTGAKFRSIKGKTITLDKLKQVLDDGDSFVNSVLDRWFLGGVYWDYDTNIVTNRIKSELIKKIQEILKEIERCESEIESNAEILLSILNLEDFQIDGKQYKIAQYEQIPSASFKRVIAILKTSRETLFPDIIEFKTELEFKNFEYRKKQFDFAVDATNAITSCNHKNEGLKKSIESLEESLLSLRREISVKLIQELKNTIQEIEIEIDALNDDWDQLIKQNSKLVERQASLFELRDRDISNSQYEIEKKKNEKRFEVMREKKGLYNFDWKHERKSWKSAFKPVYFDIGESYLFEMVEDGLFKKIEIVNFLQRYLGKT